MSDFADRVQTLTRLLADAEQSTVETRQTHLSVVFLTDRHAYKLRKPVSFDFIDLSSRESRYINSWNEVLLNRRLADDVYEAVVPVLTTGETLTLDAAAAPGGAPPRVVDWLVRMRRLDDAHTLQACFDHDEPVDRTRFHRAITRFCEFLRAATPVRSSPTLPERMHAAIVDNLSAIDQFARHGALPRIDVDRLRSALLQWNALHRELLHRRELDGWVRDGHGDLKAEHIYLTDPPQIIDCLEFSSALRAVDTLDEICFLTNDLERSGATELIDELWELYRAALDDPASDELAAYYRAYRLSVRAKVVGLRAGGPEGDAFDGESEPLRAAVDRAVELLQPFHRPQLLAVCGLSGSGKSTLAKALSERLGTAWIRSDQIRKELYAGQSDPDVLYSQQASERTYAEMENRAQTALQSGVSVVLDATFQRRRDRDQAARIGGPLQAPLQWIECRCPTEVALERIRRRSAQQTDPSDADVEVFLRQQSAFEPLGSDESPVVIETDQPLGKQVDQIVTHLAVV